MLLICSNYCYSNTLVDKKDNNINFFKKIVIDAGHGGKDAGATINNVLEKNINLQISLILGKLISDSYPKTEVIYTRNQDNYLCLSTRTIIANNAKADLFISLHCNYHKNCSINGVEIFVLKPFKSYFNFKKNYIDNIKNVILKNKFINESIILSYFIKKELSKNNIFVRNIKQANFLVIKHTKMPSILIEIGYLSNKDDFLYINSSIGKKKIAKCILKALITYNNIVCNIY
ncbi:MAG: N-acetylmuramoyl-L-alanine amidase [Bacteroides sp.]|nr:MAG: N-acetylmuramoyl-L-alanine amidase [Bacteroides sp.]